MLSPVDRPVDELLLFTAKEIDIPMKISPDYPSEVEPLDPLIGVNGIRGRLRMALQRAGFVEHINDYNERYSTRAGVWIRLADEDDDLDVCLYPTHPDTGVPSEICRWRVSFGPGCPDELIIPAVNYVARQDWHQLAEAAARQTRPTP
ncbi:hypothetical protein AB0M43_14505 [Longispora sp. NPDC051575]|uniref:hypothetical protein n=1 Tax=Longispora sp. NPDC051575 TaxID=3154943 RepID=UPI00343C28EC